MKKIPISARLASRLAVVSVATVLALSACSSSSSSPSADASTEAAPASSAAASDAAPASEAPAADYDLAAAQAAADATTTRPTSIGIDAAIEGTIPEGKTIALIQCGAPACVDAGNYLEAATKAVGWKLDRIDAGLSAETIKAAWAQAVESKVDGIVASGFPSVLFTDELAQAAELGIPVVDQIVSEEPGNGISLVLAGTDYQKASGATIAQYMLAQNGGVAFPSLAVISSSFPSLVNQGDGFSAAMTAACATCTVDTLDVPATSIGGDLPTRVTSYLSAHPDVKWVWVGYSDMATGLPQALTAAGLDDVKLVTFDSSPTTAGYLKDGTALVALDGYPAPEIMWRSVDFFIRHFNGEDTSVDQAETLPVWMVLQDSVPTTTSSFPLVENYEADYKALWKIS